MRRIRLMVLLGLVMLIVAACASANSPQPRANAIIARAQATATWIVGVRQAEGILARAEASATAIVADALTQAAVSATPVPPSHTPTPLPPTVTPSHTPTAIPPTPTSTETAASNSEFPEIYALFENADAENGRELFNLFQPAASFACVTCHRFDSEQLLIGPGLLNVSIRAETRVEGQSAFDYIYTSIINPDAYVVEGFSDALMPENWTEIYSDAEIADIIAYLYTLTDD